jgi:hypothetical protein
MKSAKYAGISMITLITLAFGPVAMADWNSFKELFKAKSSEVMESGALSQAGEAVGLSSDEIARGLKEALGKGAQSAVERLGQPDGFLGNADVKIPMPKHLSMVEKGLRAIGQDARADEFVASMNRAAERAVPEAATVFGEAISKMSIDDAKGILQGGDNAATDYLKRSSADDLKAKFRPLVDAAVRETGVTRQYQAMVDKASLASSLVDTDKLDLGGYVTDKALDGVFFMVGEEERKIRANPAARTTELLKKVFAK